MRKLRKPLAGHPRSRSKTELFRMRSLCRGRVGVQWRGTVAGAQWRVPFDFQPAPKRQKVFCVKIHLRASEREIEV
jgi:hypothetical protein